MSLGCDVVATMTKAYADGARDLQKFATQMKKHYGDAVSPEVLQATFQTAAKSYRTQSGALEQIKAEMAKTIITEARANRSGSQKAGDIALSVASLPRTLMTTADLSMTLRQAFGATLAHPRMAAKAMQDQVRAMFGSRKYGVTGEGWAHQVDQEIRSRANYPLYEESGLFLAPIEKGIGDLVRHEEAYQSNLPEHIPGVRHVVRASERAAITYLNKMRADVFDDLVRRADPGDGSLDMESARKIADFVNNATGRGNLPGMLERSSQLLSTVFFSPKLVASRVGFLKESLQYGAKAATEPVMSRFGKGMTPTEKAIAIEYARTVGAVATIMGLVSLTGAQVGTDPRSSDFMKARYGKMRVDLLGGHQQYVVLLARMLTGKTVNPQGQERSLDDQRFGSSSRGDVMTHFARGKLSPITGLAADFMAKKQSKDYPTANRPFYQKQIGTDFLGRPTTLQSDAERMLIPLHISGFAQTLAEGEGVPKAVFGAIAEMLGAGVNTYSSGKQPRVPEQPITDYVRKRTQ